MAGAACRQPERHVAKFALRHDVEHGVRQRIGRPPEVLAFMTLALPRPSDEKAPERRKKLHHIASTGLSSLHKIRRFASWFN
jgi:hypothetical protein